MAQRQRSCLPIVDQGCCCDLKTCCRVQGWLGIVTSILSIVLSIRELLSISALCEDAAKIGVDCYNDEKIKLRLAGVAVMEVIDVVIQVICLVAAIYFLVGISKGEPSKMVHYIRMMWVELFWYSIFTIAGAVLITPLYLIIFVFMGLTVYSLICANSMHIQMVVDQGGSYVRQAA